MKDCGGLVLALGGKHVKVRVAGDSEARCDSFESPARYLHFEPRWPGGPHLRL